MVSVFILEFGECEFKFLFFFFFEEIGKWFLVCEQVLEYVKMWVYLFIVNGQLYVLVVFLEISVGSEVDVCFVVYNFDQMFDFVFDVVVKNVEGQMVEGVDLCLGE